METKARIVTGIFSKQVVGATIHRRFLFLVQAEWLQDNYMMGEFLYRTRVIRWLPYWRILPEGGGK